jgi:hypothetical protein
VAIFLQIMELVLEAKLTLEELNILYVLEFLRLAGWLPHVSGFGLHQGNVFLALLYLQLVKSSTVAFDDTSVHDFVEQART